MEFYLLNYFKPGTGQKTEQTDLGRKLMDGFGCTTCHRATMVVEKDRRVADVETRYDPTRGIFNRLFATATPLFAEEAGSGSLPALRKPVRGRFVVENFFADLKRHDLGPRFWERNFDGSLQKEFMTEPLWGVGSTPPYGHDGRSINLHEAILRHGGEAQSARNRYAGSGSTAQQALQAFLGTLVLFPPDDTASNLNPGDRTAANFPQKGHGNIRLPALFLDPTELE
jgi:cytochrome c peroxidase